MQDLKGTSIHRKISYNGGFAPVCTKLERAGKLIAYKFNWLGSPAMGTLKPVKCIWSVGGCK